MASNTLLNASLLREVLSGLPDVPSQEDLIPPALSQVYFPKSHHKALSLDTSIVVGMRGAGKSLWTAILSTPKHQPLIRNLLGNDRLSGLYIRVGYGLDQSDEQFPSENVLGVLLEDFDPFDIWQTVVLQHALKVCEKEAPFKLDWTLSVAWCQQNRERVNKLLTECDEILTIQGKPLLILFDALDRLAPEWLAIRNLMKSALRLCLQCRSRRMIRLKFFLRPDMEEDPEIWEFRDSSKLKSSKVDLSWKTTDLYGLIFHILGNSEKFGEHFRNYSKMYNWSVNQNVYSVPAELINDETIQKRIIEEIAGPFMGIDSRRGYTYTWIPTHLADAMSQVSPRSFMLAFRKAAEETAEKYPEHQFALHYEAIKQGVIHASKTRVDEIKDDYPWVGSILEACRGLTVPIEIDEFTRFWDKQTLSRVREAGKKKLPPRRFTLDALRQGKKEALLDDLVELAVIYRTYDDRINMPDIFRVEFGIKRRGGVKPPR